MQQLFYERYKSIPIPPASPHLRDSDSFRKYSLLCISSRGAKASGTKKAMLRTVCAAQATRDRSLLCFVLLYYLSCFTWDTAFLLSERLSYSIASTRLIIEPSLERIRSCSPRPLCMVRPQYLRQQHKVELYPAHRYY